MNKYIIKRLLMFFVVLTGVSILSFLLLAYSGKDPTVILANRIQIGVDEELIESVRIEYGLDAPLPVQYINWIKGLFTGDMGISIYSFNHISEDLSQYLPVTLSVVSLSIIWIILITIILSILAVRFRNGIIDHIIRAITLLGICTPAFWLGFLLLLIFAIELQLFSVVPTSEISDYILPSLALAIPTACSLVRVFRSSLLTELSSDYVKYAKARDLSSNRIMIKHVMKNALPPIITLFCQYFGALIAYSVVIESVFSLRGIGSHLIECMIALDSRSTATYVVIIASVFVVSNLLGEIINGIICPWVRSDKNV